MNAIFSLLAIPALIATFLLFVAMCVMIIKAGNKADSLAKEFRSKKRNRDFVKKVFGIDVKSPEDEDAEQFERNVRDEMEARRIKREADRRERNQ